MRSKRNPVVNQTMVNQTVVNQTMANQTMVNQTMANQSMMTAASSVVQGATYFAAMAAHLSTT
jgi:hypothetical protein